MLTIVNYGMGNITSVVNALNYLNIPSQIANSSDEIMGGGRLILPGVGSYALAMKNIHNFGFFDTLNEAVLAKDRPVLGICLGMQILGDSGTEDGETVGLGWIPAQVVRLQSEDPAFKIPHVGFNRVKLNRRSSRLFSDQEDGEDFYFVHGYHMLCDKEYVTGYAEYNQPIVASVEYNNVFGVQFHPEKSQSNGLALLQRYSKL